MNVSLEPELQFLKRDKPDIGEPLKSNKDVGVFNFSSLSAQLPPNTGPPGTVQVNSTNGANSNKNLSHVPCKFFRQGICQAGSSCPFSHNLEGTLGADKLPCKYFQKGNCKFGLKCALAHFLPDGTRVNSKSYGRKNYTNYNGNGNGSRGHSSNGSNGPGAIGSSGPISNSSNINSTSNGSGSYNYNTYGSYNNNSQFQSLPIDIGFNQSTPPNRPLANFISMPQHSRRGSSGFHPNVDVSLGGYNMATPTGSHSNSYQTQSYGLMNGSSNGGGSYSGPNSATTPSSAFTPTGNGLQSGGIMRSYSSNTSPITLTHPSTSPQSNFFNGGLVKPLPDSPTNHSINLMSESFTRSKSFSTKLPNSQTSFSSFLHHLSTDQNEGNDDSAILDYDSDPKNNDDVFEEDYVPASLGDIILTPQELQRRDSRSQSGTLLVRPNLTASSSSGDVMVPPMSRTSDDGLEIKSPIHNDDVFLME